MENKIILNRMNFLFEYRDGNLIRKSRKSNRPEGEVAGWVSRQGYRYVRVDGVVYAAHRIIYAMHYGEIGIGLYVDHIDGNKSNNKIENLRIATPAQNQHNQKKLRIDNTTGVKGVSFRKCVGKYVVYAKLNGKRLYGGFFDTLGEAESKSIEFRKNIHGAYASQAGGVE